MKRTLLVALATATALGIIITAASLAAREAYDTTSIAGDDALKPFEFGNRSNGLQLGVKANESVVHFVEDAGYGESISLMVSLSSRNPDWKRLSEMREFGRGAQHNLFQVVVMGDDGSAKPLSTLQIEPDVVEGGGFRGSLSGSEWGYNIRFSLRSVIQLWSEIPNRVKIKVILNEDAAQLLAGTKQRNELASGEVEVDLQSIPFAKATFSNRLLSLPLKMDAKDVQRIVGTPLNKTPIDDETKRYWPEISSKWEYQNPDLKGEVSPERTGVTLHFDAEDSLIGVYQAFFGC